LKVQIPETGVSIDELERFLHRWLGHQTMVSGELREEAGGALSLVLHIAGADPIAVSGSGADLDHLVEAAAERAFSVFDPVNHVIFLAAAGRPDEAYNAATRVLADRGSLANSRADRADAYSLLSGFDPDRRRALSYALVAGDIDPSQLVAWMWAARLSVELGHDEAAVNFARMWIRTRKQDQPARRRDSFVWLIANGHALIDQAMGDFLPLMQDYVVMDAHPGVSTADQYAERASVAALLHDEKAGLEQLRLAIAAGNADGAIFQARWNVSAAAGAWAQALEAAKALLANERAQKSKTTFSLDWANADLAIQTEYDPLLAYAEAMTGDVTSASALIAQTPEDCYLCVRTRARVASVAGDAAGADHWFAEAVRQAPDLPMAYYEWGEALLARGDMPAAARELSLAHDKGPHFADALKAWGDVLVKQGRFEQALAKYDSALKYAPSWAALKQARDVASKHT
jgi:tetratricopeptide (TPR) repeat protein